MLPSNNWTRRDEGVANAGLARLMASIGSSLRLYSSYSSATLVVCVFFTVKFTLVLPVLLHTCGHGTATAVGSVMTLLVPGLVQNCGVS